MVNFFDKKLTTKQFIITITISSILITFGAIYYYFVIPGSLILPKFLTMPGGVSSADQNQLEQIRRDIIKNRQLETKRLLEQMQ